jgi:uncharacterized OsmC-like protein
MDKTICTYVGGLRVEAVFEPTGEKILTDAPVQVKGKGHYFSPTDLVAAALGNCILTMMGVAAEREGISLAGVTAEVDKEMSGTPSRISKLSTVVKMPAGLSAEQRAKLENIAKRCPVHASLPAEMETPTEFVYPD